MIFQIKDMFGKACFYTEYAECIPFQSLESMESVGLQFFVDGERISKEELDKKFNDVVESEDEEPDQKVVEKVEPIETKESAETIEESELPELDFPITNRTIICVNTGKYYKNQKEAADEYHCDSANISYCVTTGKAYKGLYFKRVLNK